MTARETVAPNVTGARVTPAERERLDQILQDHANAIDNAGFVSGGPAYAPWLRWTIKHWRIGAAPGEPVIGPRGAPLAPAAPPPLPAEQGVEDIERAALALPEEQRRRLVSALAATLPPAPPAEPPAAPPPPPEKAANRSEKGGKAKAGDTLAAAVAALPGFAGAMRQDPEKRQAQIAAWVRDLSERFGASETEVRREMERRRSTAEKRPTGWRKEEILAPVAP